MGNFGDGWLEHLRQWLGTQWAGLSPWECRAAQSRQARPEEAQEPGWGAAKGARHLTMLHCRPMRIDRGVLHMERQVGSRRHARCALPWLRQ